MGEHIFKRHNKTLLMYHLVFPLKYRKSVIDQEIGEGLKQICIEISQRYEVHFIEIGYESNHVHFLVQSVPSYSVSKMITMLKSITAKQLFKRYPEIKAKLWGGKFWTSGFYANTVGQYSNEEVIKAYVKTKEWRKNIKRYTRISLHCFDTSMALPRGSSFHSKSETINCGNNSCRINKNVLTLAGIEPSRNGQRENISSNFHQYRTCINRLTKVYLV